MATDLRDGEHSTATQNATQWASEAMHSAGEQARTAYTAGMERASEAYDKASASYEHAAQRAGETYAASRERMEDAWHSTRDNASRLWERGTEMIEKHPFWVLAGGAAVGGLIALLQRDTIRDYGNEILAKAHEAAESAREAASEGLASTRAAIDAEGLQGKVEEGVHHAREAFESLTEKLDFHDIKGQLSDLIERATDTVNSAGKAAAETLRGK